MKSKQDLYHGFFSAMESYKPISIWEGGESIYGYIRVYTNLNHPASRQCLKSMEHILEFFLKNSEQFKIFSSILLA